MASRRPSNDAVEHLKEVCFRAEQCWRNQPLGTLWLLQRQTEILQMALAAYAHAVNTAYALGMPVSSARVKVIGEFGSGGATFRPVTRLWFDGREWKAVREKTYCGPRRGREDGPWGLVHLEIPPEDGEDGVRISLGMFAVKTGGVFYGPGDQIRTPIKATLVVGDDF